MRGVLVGTTFVLALTGCGSTESQTTEPATGDDLGASSPSTPAPRGAREERITSGGIAAIVLDHLGPDVVRRFATSEPEPGSVSVMIRLRDATPHNFAIQVYSPRQARMFGEAGRCPGERRTEGDFRCRTLGNGTTVITWEDPHGFSDDNADGMVISGSAITKKDGGVLALYESYDDSPAISVADLEDLLTDPQLSWLTDPPVNQAGADIAVTDLSGS